MPNKGAKTLEPISQDYLKLLHVPVCKIYTEIANFICISP